GCSSSAFRTASSPSDTSQMTCNSRFVCSLEMMNRRKGSKSSTTKTRTNDLGDDIPIFLRATRDLWVRSGAQRFSINSAVEEKLSIPQRWCHSSAGPGFHFHGQLSQPGLAPLP